SVTSDVEWVALRFAMGDPAWAADPRFDTLLGRQAYAAELEEHLAAWTRERAPREVMDALQTAGVPAAAVNTMADLFADPQLAHRGYWGALPHPELGTFRFEGSGWTLSDTPARAVRPSPCMGEHNHYVFCTLLGLAEAELLDLEERKIVY